MADAPWTKIFHEDFLQGVSLANMSAEEIGVYTVVLMLMAARGGPIEADSRWINGYARCASARKCTAVLDRLTDLGKLERRGKLIGNPKMLGVITERDKRSVSARKAAFTRWHGDEAQLPLDQPDDNYRPEKRGDKWVDKGSDKSQITSQIKSGEPRKTAKTDNADASRSVRARDSETQSLDSSHPNKTQALESAAELAGGSGSGEGQPRLGNADLMGLYEAVCKASGFTTSSPGGIDRAMKQVEAWKKAGIDFDTVVIPTIRNAVASSSDPTRILSRFDKAVRHQHARSSANAANGKAYTPPASPVLEPPGEDPRFRQLRADLLQRLGPFAFSNLVNPVRFEIVDDHTMRVTHNRPGSIGLMDGDRTRIVTNAAKALGFTRVWS
jgi:hypothetical protein